MSQHHKPQLYAQLASELANLIADEPSALANLANAAALLYHSLPQVNWAGFYVWDGQELVLGPFQGKPACVRIALGKGVCGAAALQRASVVVTNVHEFSGHITCDAASNSEIVVPLLKDGELLGVLDIDSPLLGRFDAEDRLGLEAFAAALLAQRDVIDWFWRQRTA